MARGNSLRSGFDKEKSNLGSQRLAKRKETDNYQMDFQRKEGCNRENAKLKARIVARGFEHVEGEDYYEKFAHVVHWNTIKTDLAIVARKQWKLRQLDVKIAFLYGTLKEDVYMEIPEGFREPGTQGKVAKLKQALYGLK